jgi:shikimate dehydrogenase
MNSINPAGPRAFVTGWPVKHSRSPLIHGYWLHEYGLGGTYELAEIAPEKFADFLENLGTLGYVGGNVTVPYKEKAFSHCAGLTKVAANLKAVNTLWMESGKLWGDNTDVSGFLAALDSDAPGWEQNCQKAVVLGAGGAARAILEALSQRCVNEIIILNRTLSRAQSLMADFNSIVACRIPTDAGDLSEVDLIVNTTSLGMVGEPPLVFDLGVLPSRALVVDIVYVPLETQLLKQARQMGLRTVSGLSMLLHQAVPAFERWFGKKPEVSSELRALIEADVRART